MIVTPKNFLLSTSLFVSILVLGMGNNTLAATLEGNDQRFARVTSAAETRSPEEEGAQFVTTPPLMTILENLTNKKISLLDRVRESNPLKLLSNISEELKLIDSLAPTNRDLTIYELVIKGMWALYFHHQMTCEFPPHNAKEFFGIVLNVKPSLSSSANLSKNSKKLNRKKGNKNSGGEGTVSSNKKFSNISMLDEN